MNKKGLAQIPLMIGLLIMAIAVPVATRLAQQNQENRGQAKGEECTRDSDCGSGYLCKNGICVPKSAPTSTPRPPTSTPRPVATNTPVPSCRGEGQSCASISCCNSQGLYCNSARICVKSATPTPIPPTAVPTLPCISDGNCLLSGRNCCSGNTISDPLGCTTKLRCSKEGNPPPTITPVPTLPCISDGNCLLSGRNCCSGNTISDPLGCTTKLRCSSGISATPTPLQCIRDGLCLTSGKSCCPGSSSILDSSCSSGKRCIDEFHPCNGTSGSGVCRNTGCLSDEVDIGQASCSAPGIRCCIPKPTSTPTPTCLENGRTTTSADRCCSKYAVYQGGSLTCTPKCLDDGRITTSADRCCSKYAEYQGSSLICTTKPSATPTKIPTSTPRPTSIPCANTGQSCTTRLCCTTADVCTDEGLSYPICVPRNQIPTYIPIPTIDCAKSGQACSTKPCCEPYLDVCTDEGLSYPRCVPRNQIPTYIPVPTMMPCANTGQSCSPTLGCCAMTDKCTSGKCVALSPTATPTNAPGACSKYPMPNGCSCNIGSQCSSGYCSEAKKCENPPSPSNKCPGAEACPNSSNKNLLQNCTPPDSDGTPKDTLCNKAGIIEPCGGKNYCCPSVGGAWTTDMTKCPSAKCTQCSGKPQAKSKGDADCSGTTTLNDYSIWRSEFISGSLGTGVKIDWRADFDCDGKVTLNDFSIWRENFVKSL